MSLLQVDGLRVRLQTPDGPATVVDGIDYRIEPGEVFGIAGESGSGKTMSVLALMGLLPQGAAVEGQAVFEGQDLLRLPPSKLRRICGRGLAMVFQDPMTSLHPMLSIGTQLTDHVRLHLGLGRRAAAELAVDALREVRIPDPESTLHAFPHQFSGGMRQRIAIAVALACRPKLLVADEPTTALDVTVQAGIIRLLDRLRNESGLTIVLITHDLGVLSSIADRVAIFYAGRVVEAGPEPTCSVTRGTPIREGSWTRCPTQKLPRHRSSRSRARRRRRVTFRPAARSIRAVDTHDLRARKRSRRSSR